MFLKKQLPLLIALVVGCMLLIQYFVPSRTSQDFFTLYTDWAIVIGVFASVMAFYSMLRHHITRIVKKSKDWFFSIITLGCFVTMIVGWLVQGVGPGSLFDNMFTYGMVQIEATIFSLLAFYISSAAYRSFRARSAQATALLIAAVILMLGRVPLGRYIGTEAFSLVDFANWILNVPNMAAKRGIQLGIGLGSLLLSMKILLGIERNYLGGGRD